MVDVVVDVVTDVVVAVVIDVVVDVVIDVVVAVVIDVVLTLDVVPIEKCFKDSKFIFHDFQSMHRRKTLLLTWCRS